MPKFTLIEERSSNGAPSVSVTFADGYTDRIVLKKFYNNKEDRMAEEEHCNFLGHLENEKEACVAMTGCLGQEDVEFTIMSSHALESPMFKWSKGGQVEIIENPFLVC